MTKILSKLMAVLCCGAFFLSCSGHKNVYGYPQDMTDDSPITERNSAISTLRTLLQSAENLKTQLEQKKEAHKTARTPTQKLIIEEEINRLHSQLETLQRDFEKIATGIDLDSFLTTPKKEFDWNAEIREMLEPVVKELKNITAQPRQVEKLRGEAAYYEKQLPLVKKAIFNIKELAAQTQDAALIENLVTLENLWKSREQQISSQLAVVRYQLDEKTKSQKSFLESAQEIMRVFFKSRGRNFLLSLAAFLAFFLIARFVHQLICKYSPLHQTGYRSFYVRVGDVVYHLLTFMGATGASFAVLYLSGDWVLLSLALLFILGIIWTAKHALPIFWEQGKILLNVGTIRENERVIYNGIPWKVSSLNFYTYFENPELKESRIRLPLKSIVGMNSRPYHPDEPWFPCRENDWVIMDDGTLGKVAVQSPEMVQLVLRGDSRKTYVTELFLKANPTNISHNFRLWIPFRIDYRHQLISTHDIPDKMKAELKELLAKEGYEAYLFDIRVEFKEACESSLNMEIIADFSGKVAEHYYKLSRLMQRIAVEACNIHGWVIPFPQITLHIVPVPSEKDLI